MGLILHAVYVNLSLEGLPKRDFGLGRGYSGYLLYGAQHTHQVVVIQTVNLNEEAVTACDKTPRENLDQEVLALEEQGAVIKKY